MVVNSVSGFQIKLTKAPIEFALIFLLIDSDGTAPPNASDVAARKLSYE